MDTLKIGKFISQKRKEKNMTQEELASILGVTNKTVSRWENGNYMPDLSLLKPLSEVLGISLNELLSGEESNYDKKADENIEHLADYSKGLLSKYKKNTYALLMIFGVFIIILALIISPSESSFGAIYSTVGLLILAFGFFMSLKRFKLLKRVLLTVMLVLTCSLFLRVLDYVSVVNYKVPPRFRISVETRDNVITYNTLFYKLFRINYDTPNEYYILDNSTKYNFDTVPKSLFNRDKSGIDNIIKYKNKHVGNNSNVGNLINALPLADNGYVFEIDDKGLVINYYMTDWHDEDYTKSALLYNSVSLFLLIDNLDSVTYNFSGSSYFVSRDSIEEYPNYFKVSKNGIDKDAFNEYVEAMMNDGEFAIKYFDKLISRI